MAAVRGTAWGDPESMGEDQAETRLVVHTLVPGLQWNSINLGKSIRI